MLKPSLLFWDGAGVEERLGESNVGEKAAKKRVGRGVEGEAARRHCRNSGDCVARSDAGVVRGDAGL
jgi:hypothetical protein